MQGILIFAAGYVIGVITFLLALAIVSGNR